MVAAVGRRALARMDYSGWMLVAIWQWSDGGIARIPVIVLAARDDDSALRITVGTIDQDGSWLAKRKLNQYRDGCRWC